MGKTKMTKDSKEQKSKEQKSKEQKSKEQKSKEQKYKGTKGKENKKKEQLKKKGFEYQSSDLPTFLNECRFGDEYFFYEGQEGTPKYENINEKWDEFVQWMEGVRERNKSVEGFEDGEADRVGHEVIKWAKRHDVYAIFILTKPHWESFRDTYLLAEGCPEIVLEFIRGIMYEKMTEKEMWGTREDRSLKGKLIIYDKAYLPKEGEDTGDLEIEYCPITYTEEEMDIEDKSCPIEYYPREKGLFPRVPVIFET